MAHLPTGPLAEALGRRNAVLDDLHLSRPGGPIDLDILVPVAPPHSSSNELERSADLSAAAPIGVIVLRLNANRFLFPMLRRWPTLSESAETLLVRRDGDDVVFLNDLRHQPDAALTLRRPIAQRTLPAAMAVRGEFGIREGRDYRDVAVVATSRAIANSPWILVAKIDQAEAYAPIRMAAWRNGALVVVRLGMVALGAVLIWRQRHAASLRRALAVERERNMLAERLAMVTRHANDIILLFDDDMRILEANERALAAYGRTLDEMRQLTARDLRVASAEAKVNEDFNNALGAAGTVFEAEHRRKDGSVFPVEVSARLIESEDRQVLSIVRDITHRKREEAKLRASEARVRAIADSAQDAILMMEPTGEISFWNPAAERMLGYAQAEAIGQNLHDLIVPQRFHAAFHAALPIFLRTGQGAIVGETVDLEARRKDAREIPVQLSLSAIQIDGAWHAVGIIRDITIRKRDEEILRVSLHEKEVLLKEVHHRVKNNLQVISSLLRLEAARSKQPATRETLRDMQGRIRSMALLHETIYRSANIARVDLAVYLTNLSTQLFRSLVTHPGLIRLKLNLASASVDIDQAIPCGLLLNELLTNALKHGFPDGRAGEVRVEFQPVGGAGELRLRVSDSGIGLPPDFAEKRQGSLGLQLVSDLSRQLGGKLEARSESGAVFEVFFTPTPAPLVSGPAALQLPMALAVAHGSPAP